MLFFKIIHEAQEVAITGNDPFPWVGGSAAGMFIKIKFTCFLHSNRCCYGAGTVASARAGACGSTDFFFFSKIRKEDRG